MAKWLVQAITCGATTLIVACASIAGIGDAVDDTADGGPTPSSTQSSSSGSSGTSSTSSGASSTSGSSTTSSGGGTTSSTSSSGASTSSSGATDAGEDANLPIVDSGVAGCMLKQNNDNCTKHDDCCSDHCKQNFKCDSSCSEQGDSCKFGSNDNCCFGSYCGGPIGLTCVECIQANNPADRPGGQFYNPYSCCSRNVNITNGMCLP